MSLLHNNYCIHNAHLTISIVYPYLTVILVAFTEDGYTVDEGDMVEVCVEIVEVLSALRPPDGFVNFTVFTSSDTALGM